jgi:AraC-like DNA-binding protein
MHLTEHYRSGALNILGLVLLNCRDGQDVLDRLRRYASLLNDGLTVTLEHAHDRVGVRTDPVAGLDNFMLTDGRQVTETMLAGVVLTLRRLADRPFVPLSVSFRHAPGGDVAEYHRIFGSLVRFGETDDRVVLRLDDLRAPVRSADPTLLPMLEAHAQERLAALERKGAVSRRVLHEVARRLNGTAPEVGVVASALAMSPRALQRALKEEGSTFQSILDEARRAVAERELRSPGATAAEVALLLGYSESSAFTRGFRRWTGMTPSAWASRAVNA